MVPLELGGMSGLKSRRLLGVKEALRRDRDVTGRFRSKFEIGGLSAVRGATHLPSTSVGIRKAMKEMVRMVRGVVRCSWTRAGQRCGSLLVNACCQDVLAGFSRKLDLHAEHRSRTPGVGRRLGVGVVTSL